LTTFELQESGPQPIEVAPGTRYAGQIEAWQAELDGYYKTIGVFDQEDPEDVMMYLSAFAARAAEIRSQLNRNDSRRAQAFRIKEIDPFISALEFQFKIWSRYVSIKEFDAKLQRGQV
jgi:hypothetical protein